MTDITFRVNDVYFICKVGAIIIHEEKLLMIKNDDSPYYYPVGGRVKFGETTEAAVIRESHEETGITFEVDRLAFIHENFFVADFMDNTPCHEIAFYYLMKQSDDIDNATCNSFGFNGIRESMHWISLSELTKHHLYPDFFKTELQVLGSDVGHFITQNMRTFRA